MLTARPHSSRQVFPGFGSVGALIRFKDLRTKRLCGCSGVRTPALVPDNFDRPARTVRHSRDDLDEQSFRSREGQSANTYPPKITINISYHHAALP